MGKKVVNSGFYIGKIHRLSNRLMNHILLERGIQAFNGEQIIKAKPNCQSRPV